MESLKAGLSKATNVVSNAAEEAQEKARAISVDAKEKVADVKEKVADVKEKVKDAKDAAVEKLKDASLGLAKRVATAALTKVGDKVVNAAIMDPDMPGIVKKGISLIVKDVVDEVQIEVEQKLEGKWAGKNEAVADSIMAERAAFCCPNPFSYLRAWILHTLYPHDKSAWAKMKQYSWWIIMVISHIPVFGVTQAWWLLVFLLHDKCDTFQVVKFILQIKTSAVIAVGLLPSWIGIVAYINCVDKNDKESTCLENGPWQESFIISALWFSIQVLMSWFAVFCIPFTKARGVRNIIEGKNKTNSRGIHKLKYWIMYDLIVCIVIAVLVYLTMNEPNYRIMFYWIKCLYGWLCLPWYVLKMPFMNLLILHSKPTAYNPRGETVPFANSKERKILRDRRLGRITPV